MILFRAGSTLRIDAQHARGPAWQARYAEGGTPVLEPADESTGEHATLAFRRWWAEMQPEARWAAARARGAFVVDVSHSYWRDGAFLLTFDDAGDAQRFALTFLGRDQAECEEAMRDRKRTAYPGRSHDHATPAEDKPLARRQTTGRRSALANGAGHAERGPGDSMMAASFGIPLLRDDSFDALLVRIDEADRR